MKHSEPKLYPNYFIWTRTKTKIQNSDEYKYTDPVCINGIKGDKGPKGDTGPKGADGKNAITMTSATTPNGEYNGQIGIWRGQLYSWNGTSWVLTSGILPKDPVLHYSFDDLPDLPDGTSQLAVMKNTYESLKNWTEHTVPEIRKVNGNIEITSPTLNAGIFKYYTIKTTEIVKIKVKVKTGGINQIGIEGFDVTYGADSGEYVFSGDGKFRAVILYGKPGSVFEVEEVYIGDASFTKPVIDNSKNNHNATDVKGLATKGVSGKCLRSFSAINTGFTTKTLPLSANWSYSMWVSLESSKLLAKANKYHDYDATYSGMATMLFGVNNSYNSYGIEILCDNMFSGTKTVAVNVFERNQNSSEIKNYVISSKIVDKGFVNITVSRDDSNTKIYCDGLFVGSFSKIKTDLEIDKVIGINVAGFHGSNYRTRPTDFVIDDFQIFDRPLSDQEVLGLYLARGNTPKQYTMADYQLDNSSGKYYGYAKPAVPFKNDTYLNTTTGYLYEYDGVKWVAIIDVSDSRYNQAINDMIAFAENNPDLPFITARNAWIKRLTVGGLLANEIATKMLIVRDKGVIKSENYNGTIDENGNITAYGSAGWAIDHAGKSDFVNINATGGNFNNVSVSGFIGAKGLDFILEPGDIEQFFLFHSVVGGVVAESGQYIVIPFKGKLKYKMEMKDNSAGGIGNTVYNFYLNGNIYKSFASPKSTKLHIFEGEINLNFGDELKCIMENAGGRVSSASFYIRFYANSENYFLNIINKSQIKEIGE